MIRCRAPAALVSTALAAVSLSGTAGPPEDTDEARNAWRFRRPVTVPASPAGKPAFAALSLPPEIFASAQAELHDLRLVGGGGAEAPYVIDRRTDWLETNRWEGRLADTSAAKKSHTVWVVDLGAPRAFDTIELRIDGNDFAKRVRVEAAEGADGPWRTIREDAGVFDRPWTARVHHTAIPLREPVTARCVRLTADDRQTPPVVVSGAVAVARRFIPGERWRLPFSAAPADLANPQASLYRLDLPPGLPFDTIELGADDPAFSRAVAIHAERTSGGRAQRDLLGRGTVYRLRLDDATAGESLVVSVTPCRQGGSFLLEIVNGDSPPLRNVRGAVYGTVARLLFPVESSKGLSWTLYYGNAATRGPLYDLEGLKNLLGRRRGFVPAALGAESANPKYRQAPPLQFAPSAGAPLDVARWRWMRRLSIPEEETLYTATLAPGDVSALRRDLGDLRIADGKDLQVPYLLDPAASEAEVPLRVDVERRPGGAAPSVSRYRLAAPVGPDGRAAELPPHQLRLDFAETFFARTARLLEPPARGLHKHEHVLFAGRIDRQGTGGAPEPVRIDLDGNRREALILEIDEGDNAPLTLRGARGAVRVPRVVFKLKPGPGGYRLLFGNPHAEPPRYDLDVLRREVLAYSAAPVAFGAIEPNAAHRPGAADFLRDTPPSAILWVILGVAVLVLLIITVRLLRKPAG